LGEIVMFIMSARYQNHAKIQVKPLISFHWLLYSIFLQCYMLIFAA